MSIRPCLVPLPGDLFHVRSVLELNEEVMQSRVDDLVLATSIIEELNLDTRVWSKA